MAVQINQGTQTSIYTKTNAGTDIQVIKLDIGSGTGIADFGGTILAVNSGTIKLNMVPVVTGTSIVVVGTSGGSLWGTIVAASGAGTKQYVSGVQIIGVAGTTEVAVTNIGIGGSSGAGVLMRGFIPPSGGIAQNFNPVIASGTNGTIAYWIGTAGTVDITVQYWQGV